MLNELKNRGVSVALLISLATVILGLSLSSSSVYAQRATPEPVVERATTVPPAPTPITIVIEESVSVGETSGNGSLDSITEDIAIEEIVDRVEPLKPKTIPVAQHKEAV